MSQKKQSRKEFRKEIKQPDEFQTRSNTLLVWAQENPDQVKKIVAAFVAIVIVAGFFGYRAESQRNESMRDFWAGSELYARGQWEPAAETFDTLATELPGTVYGRLARVYAGGAAAAEGQQAAAIAAWRAYLNDSIPSPAIEQLVRLNLGKALSSIRDTEAAERELQAAAELPGPAGPQVQLALARHYESAGADGKALEAYARYLEEEPRGAAYQLARARIVALGGEPPVADRGLPGGIQVSTN